MAYPNRGLEFEDDSLTDSFVNEQSERGKIEPEGGLRIAALTKNEVEAYTFYVGIEGQIQAGMKSISIGGSQTKEVSATLHMPIAIECRLTPFQFLVGTAIGFSFLYQRQRVYRDVRTRFRASFGSGMRPLMVQIRFSPHLRMGVLWYLWSRSYQISILYQK